MINKINGLNDVRQFAWDLIHEGVSFHCDDKFEDILCNQDGKIEPFYTSEEAQKRNELMEQSFEVCEREGAEIYGVMLDVILEDQRIKLKQHEEKHKIHVG